MAAMAHNASAELGAGTSSTDGQKVEKDKAVVVVTTVAVA